MIKQKYEDKEFSFEPHPTYKRFIDLTGVRSGRLTVIGYAGVRDRNSEWYCLCACGNVVKIPVCRIKNELTKSCGCLAKELASKRLLKHGQCRSLTATYEYNSYMSAYGRCNNPNNIAYHNYGGRGIKFLFHDFNEFLEHLGERPSPAHSIDRIDVDGNYEIGNVRWATSVEQCNNKRTNLFLTIMGETKTLTQWCNFDHKHRVRAGERIRKGWCSKCAIFNPPRKMCEHL